MRASSQAGGVADHGLTNILIDASSLRSSVDLTIFIQRESAVDKTWTKRRDYGELLLPAELFRERSRNLRGIAMASHAKRYGV